MIGFFGLIFLVVMVFVIIAVVSTLAWLLSAGLIALAVSVLAGLAFSALITGTPDPWSSAALLSGGAFFILSMSAFRAIGRRRRDRLRQYRNPTINVSARRAPDPKPEPTPAPAAPADGREPVLTAAFEQLGKAADFARSRLGVVRSSCVLFLAASDGLPDQAEAADFAILIRKRVPEHIDECLAACRNATAMEAKALLEEAVVDLERLGARADKRRSALMAAGGPGKRRSLLARRLDEEDPFS